MEAAVAEHRSFKWRIIDSVGGCCYWGIKSSPVERALARVRVWKGAGNSEAIHNVLKLSSAALGEARFQGLARCLLRCAEKPGEGQGAQPRLCPSERRGERPRARLGIRWELSLPGVAPPLSQPPTLYTWSVLVEKAFRCRFFKLDVLIFISLCILWYCLGNLCAPPCKHVHCSILFALQC